MCKRIVSCRSGCWVALAVTTLSVSLFVTGSGCGRSSPPPAVPQRADSTQPSNVIDQPDAPSGDRGREVDVEDQLGELRSSDGEDSRLVASGREDEGAQLYIRHCAACHGEQGDAQGIAATYLFPKPRDFRAGRFRLVSTVNRTPSRDDLLNVLRRGMPGSSMPPWDHLTDRELDLLVDHVQWLHREGMRDLYVSILVDEEELTPDELQAPDVQQEIQQFADQRTQPGEATLVPPIADADDNSIARGKELYVRQACNKCHGDTGRGDGGQRMVDDEGYPMTPRDFTAGIFKGGHDPASIYRRISYGMPGTPMPSSQLTPTEIVDLSHFILSLSDEKTREDARLRRHQVAAVRVDDLPANTEDSGWNAIDATSMRMTPLWWRNESHPVIDVQAVHDGQTLALRLSWSDETHDLHAVTSERFEDAVAVEFYQGDEEPFVGMGGPNAPIDLWFWDADRQSPVDVEQQYPNAVVDIYPFHETQVDTAEGDRLLAATESQPPISLPAVAIGNPIVPVRDDPNSGGSSLTAGGPQTITFRMPNNRAVEAHGRWDDGRWTVMLKRALEAPGDDGGISFAPDQRISVAFAVFNGAKNDRDGQKLITVWNDLTLDK